MNFNYKYLKKFHPVSGRVDFTLINDNYLIIADIQGRISIIFQMHSIKSFMGIVSVNF